ncbi:MAG: hypothetical protein KJ709_04465 [Nanoarchaeota archaeon]|nr:hypothetical protein [Nanoarchaeota archaeon]
MRMSIYQDPLDTTPHTFFDDYSSPDGREAMRQYVARLEKEMNVFDYEKHNRHLIGHEVIGIGKDYFLVFRHAGLGRPARVLKVTGANDYGGLLHTSCRNLSPEYLAAIRGKGTKINRFNLEGVVKMVLGDEGRLVRLFRRVDRYMTNSSGPE